MTQIRYTAHYGRRMSCVLRPVSAPCKAKSLRFMRLEAPRPPSWMLTKNEGAISPNSL